METSGTRSLENVHGNHRENKLFCSSMPGNWDGIALPRCISVRSIIKQAQQNDFNEDHEERIGREIAIIMSKEGEQSNSFERAIDRFLSRLYFRDRRRSHRGI